MNSDVVIDADRGPVIDERVGTGFEHWCEVHRLHPEHPTAWTRYCADRDAGLRDR